MSLLDEVLQRLDVLPPEQRQEAVDLAAKATKDMVWVPNPGPQTEAFFCDADELFYGGSAGGGKSDLMIGLSLTSHRKSLILRRTNKEASKLFERYRDVLDTREGWNGQDSVWRLPDGRVIDIGGCQLEEDKQKYKGTPHDLIGFDEVSDFTETQYRFITIWNRSAEPGQRCRVVAAGNPPTRPEGLWVQRYWGPWLEPNHPNPALPGELRWFIADAEVDGPGPHDVDGKMVRARSRTFLPARLEDNPDLAATDYDSVLANLPEELRMAYREGRFDVGLQDGAFQVIPTAWIVAAQARWKPDGYDGFAMSAMALDPAGGGRDSAELAARYGGWYAPMVTAKGAETADGSMTAAMVVKHRRDGCPIVVDVGGGYGGAVTLRLKDNEIPHRAFNGANTSTARTKDGKLTFANKRAEAWWKFREELDPSQEGGSVIALPPDPELKADLATPSYTVSARGILLESKKDIRKRIGRSPGKGDAVVMALSEGSTAIKQARAIGSEHGGRGRPIPKVIMGHQAARRR